MQHVPTRGMIGILLAIIAALLLSTVPATAKSVDPTPVDIVPLTDREIAEMRALFEEYGVDQGTQDDLIAKLKKGELWDSFNPDVDLVSTETEVRDGERVTIERFPDGSTIATTVPLLPSAEEIEATEGEIGVRGVSGCSTSGSYPTYYYSGCTADVTLITVSMGFTFNAQRDYNHSRATITSYCCYDFWTILATMSNHRLERISSSKVRYSADYRLDAPPNPSGTAWMQANVSMSSMWTTHN